MANRLAPIPVNIPAPREESHGEFNTLFKFACVWQRLSGLLDQSMGTPELHFRLRRTPAIRRLKRSGGRWRGSSSPHSARFGADLAILDGLVPHAPSLRRARNRLPSANSVSSWAGFLARPRYRVFAPPNWRLITRKECSALARTLAMIRSIRASTGCNWSPWEPCASRPRACLAP